MNAYTFYKASGELIFTYSGFSLDTVIENNSDLKYIEGSYDSNIYYILNGQVEERPAQNSKIDKIQIKADGIDTLIIFEAPIGVITIYGQNNNKIISSNINNTETFVTTIPDIYQIAILAFPYLPFNITFKAI
jgi:hypothetical protein